MPRQNKRRSITLGLRTEYNSCDSETDIFQSDQEEELVKLLDYSSQDDDVSPSIFHDNCEEAIAYIESLMRKTPERSIKDDDLNVRYNLTSRNSIFDMDWRVLKYGENIFLGELKKLVDIVVQISDKDEVKRKQDTLKRIKATTDLDIEMKRLSQVIEDLDFEVTIPTEPVKKEVTSTKTKHTIVQLKNTAPEVLTPTLKNTIFKVKKVKPINLRQSPSPDLKILQSAPAQPVTSEPSSPDQKQKDEPNEITVRPESRTKEVKIEFWKLFKDDTEWWKALAKRNLEKMEETRRELDRFSGHELVLEEIKTEIDKYEKEKETLQTFIEEVDNSKAVKKDLEYNKKYEDIVLKLIEFAKKDFIYKGFDPLIEKLKALSNVQIEGRKKNVVHIQDIINIYSQIDVSKYTYEELCLLEKYYKEVIRKYKIEAGIKDNVMPKILLTPDSNTNDRKSAPPSFHRNVILNVHSSQNLTKNINHYSSGSLKRPHTKNEHSESNLDIFDMTRTYPLEYYANNWWSIYEDILKNREHQFGTIDNWWKFYETMINKKETTEEDLNRIRAIMEYRSTARRSRPNSRMEEQLRMLDEMTNSRFRESEDVKTSDNDSVRFPNSLYNNRPCTASNKRVMQSTQWIAWCGEESLVMLSGVWIIGSLLSFLSLLNSLIDILSI